MHLGRDPWINWEMGWRAIKQTLKKIQKTRDEEERKRVRPEDRLYDVRMNLGTDPSREQLHQL